MYVCVCSFHFPGRRGIFSTLLKALAGVDQNLEFPDVVAGAVSISRFVTLTFVNFHWRICRAHRLPANQRVWLAHILFSQF